MTQQLNAAFRALADELETGAVGPVAETVWRSGTRRRWRRRGGAGLAVAAVAVVAALVVAPSGSLSTMPAGRDAGAGVTAYPQRIGHQWWTPALGDRPGPQAALLQSVEEDTGGSDWFTVSPSGERRRIPAGQNRSDVYPALSDDGRVLGYLEAPDGPYLLHDLVTGHVQRFPEVSDGGFIDGKTQPQGRFWVGGQAPAWFSPDSRHVVLPVGSPAEEGGLVLGVDGSQTLVPLPASRLAGWTDADHVVAVSLESPQRVLTYDLRTRTVTRGAVIAGLGALDEASQWTFRLSADGRRLAVALTRDLDSGRVVGLVDVASGAAVELPGCCSGVAEGTAAVDVGGDNGVDACGPAVIADRTALNADMGGSTGLVLPPFDGGGQLLSTTDPVLGARCIMWAQDALEGGPSWSLFGTSTNVLAWWWREGLLGLALVVVIAVVRRQSRRRTTVAPAPGERY